MITNFVLRVMSDTNAGLAYLVLLYINWLADQLLPDTAETTWLDRFASIWLTNGRKVAAYATGAVPFTAIASTVVSAGTIINGVLDSTTNVTINFATAAPITLGVGPT